MRQWLVWVPFFAGLALLPITLVHPILLRATDPERALAVSLYPTCLRSVEPPDRWYDPWGSRLFLVGPGPCVYAVFSAGPNRVPENGAGDDLSVMDVDRLDAIGALHLLATPTLFASGLLLILLCPWTAAASEFAPPETRVSALPALVYGGVVWITLEVLLRGVVEHYRLTAIDQISLPGLLLFPTSLTLTAGGAGFLFCYGLFRAHQASLRAERERIDPVLAPADNARRGLLRLAGSARAAQAR